MLATQTDFSRTVGPIEARHRSVDQRRRIFLVPPRQQRHATPGNFQLTAAGRLVTQDGDPVISDDGNPVEIDPDSGPWQITPEGQVSQGGESTRLALVRPRSLGDLTKVGGDLFAPLAPPRPNSDEERQVAWHSVEQSTVKPASEMMELIETSRAFEANVNLIHTQDEMLSTLISRGLGQVIVVGMYVGGRRSAIRKEITQTPDTRHRHQTPDH